MEYVSDTLDLERRIYAYGNNPSCDDGLSRRLTSIPGSQADRISQGAQILYAHYDLLGDEGKELAGLLFNYAVQNNWTAFVAGNEADKVIRLIEGKIKPADAPAPKVHFRDGEIDWRNPEAPAAAAPVQPASAGE